MSQRCQFFDVFKKKLMPHISTKQQTILTAKIITEKPHIHLTFDTFKITFIKLKIDICYLIYKCFDKLWLKGDIHKKILKSAHTISITHNSCP